MNKRMRKKQRRKNELLRQSYPRINGNKIEVYICGVVLMVDLKGPLLRANHFPDVKKMVGPRK